MPRLNNLPTKRVYCLGIGGIGVGALAEFLHLQGFCVTGSDTQPNAMTIRLQSLGIEIFNEHAIEHLDDVSLIVYSSAIVPSHPVLTYAATNNIPVVRRGELLAEILNDFTSIVVAGTHGKTTTTALMAYLFKQAQLNPCHFIGGIINDEVSPVAVTNSQYMIAEADESDSSFLFMKPNIAVITNIDADHLEAYQGDFAILKRSFLQFISQVAEGGLVVVCIDHPVIRELLPDMNRPVVTYGFSEEADFCVSDYQQHELKSTFRLTAVDDQTALALNLPGQHNVLNAVACLAVAQHLGVDKASLFAGLASFPGVGRRLQLHGDYCYHDRSISIFEDYGHHPAEIAVTIATLRQAWPMRRLVMVFQPHRYSRTQQLLDEFAAVLAQADVLLLLDIYAAGEAAIEGVSSALLAETMSSRHQIQPIMAQDGDRLFNALQSQMTPGDLIVFQGAGSVGQMAKDLSLEFA